MREKMEESQEFESNTVGIFRTAATVKGGRRFSFSALVVVGDRGGRVGMGYGKANQVPSAIEKAQKEARRKAKPYPMQGRTLPHTVTGRFGACVVRLVPASPGTGVIAGAPVRAVLEMFGVQDCLTKSYGSNNPKNLVKAALDGLSQLRSKEMVAKLRGVELAKTSVEEAIERGAAFMPVSTGEKAEAPVSKVDEKRKGGKRGRGGRGRGRGRPRQDARPDAETRPDASERKPAEGAHTGAPASEKGEPVSTPKEPEKGQPEAPPQGVSQAEPPPPPTGSEARDEKKAEKSDPQKKES